MVFNLFLFIFTVYSHSWLECPLYTGDKETYEPENCQGLPRPLNGNRNVGNVFGQDIGMDFRPSAGGARCQGNHATGTPNMVTYETGSAYTLAWPPKNHVAAACTNPFIPDAFLKLYMAPYDAASPPDQDTFREMQVPATFSDDPHVSGQIDYKGFQNCPRFCDNTDKSLCTGDFEIPAGTAPGVYTFQWYWAFNGAADLYATCWEANVVAGTSGETTTTGLPETTFGTVPPDCVGCCAAGTIQAPGTENMANYGVLENLENEFYDCPEGFEGEFKLLCLDTEIRIVDGFCVESSLYTSLVTGGENQDGTIAGLALAFVFVTIAFIIYVAFTKGWIDASTFSCGESQPKNKTSPQFHGGNNNGRNNNLGSAPAASQDTRGKANSVFTVSKTELPILPDAPVEWHYVNGADSIGPVNEPQMMAFLRAQNLEVARSTLVWNGTTVSDWTAVSDLPMLARQLR